MLPANTFFVKYMEPAEHDSEFLSLICPRLFEYLDRDCFNRVVIINSSPGGGKSTLLQMFTPSRLKELLKNKSKDTYKDTFQRLEQLGVIGNDIDILGITIPCGQDNYSLIEEIYSNGKAVQAFFKLINLRILKKTILALCELYDLDSKKNISFERIPIEWEALIDFEANGENMYRWAVKEDREMCSQINEMESEAVFSVAFNNLAVFRLIEPDNILVNGNKIKQKVLVMFDDGHTLTQNQRQYFLQTLFRTRPNIGVWFSQRLIALSKMELLGEDAKAGREYRSINIDLYVKDNRDGFYKSLKDVADRRVSFTYKEEGFEDRLEKEFSTAYLEKNVLPAIEKMKRKVNAACENNLYYSIVVEYLESLDAQTDSIYEIAVKWRTLLILIARQNVRPQQVLPFVPLYDRETFMVEYKKIKSIAEYYMCIEYDIPYYYGLDTICKLSSFNVEEFLNLAGEVFERRLALNYIIRRRRKQEISLAEQEEILKKSAALRWKSIEQAFTYGDVVQNFLKNIVKIAVATREEKRASYSGGTYTGIGIDKKEFDRMLNHEEQNKAINILRTCVAYNFLILEEVCQGKSGRLVNVFYLNRWICMNFQLPLQYGGWKPISIKQLNELVEEESTDGNQ